MADTTGTRPEDGTAAKDERSYRIGDLAREFDVTLRTLRFYEDKGLVTPERRGTTRIYSGADRERLRLALFCKRIGLPLKEIRTVLEAGSEDAPQVREIYLRQRDELAAERARVEDAQVELEGRMERMGLDVRSRACPEGTGGSRANAA